MVLVFSPVFFRAFLAPARQFASVFRSTSFPGSYKLLWKQARRLRNAYLSAVQLLKEMGPGRAEVGFQQVLHLIMELT